MIKDETFDHDRLVFGVDAKRGIGYGTWQNAAMVTLSVTPLLTKCNDKSGADPFGPLFSPSFSGDFHGRCTERTCAATARYNDFGQKALGGDADAAKQKAAAKRDVVEIERDAARDGKIVFSDNAGRQQYAKPTLNARCRSLCAWFRRRNACHGSLNARAKIHVPPRSANITPSGCLASNRFSVHPKIPTRSVCLMFGDYPCSEETQTASDASTPQAADSDTSDDVRRRSSRRLHPGL